MTDKQYLITEAQIEELRKVLPDNDWGQTLEDMLQSLPMVQDEPVGYANVDELDNLTSNGLIAIASEVSNWRKTKLYTSPQPLQPITADMVTNKMYKEWRKVFSESITDCPKDSEIIAAAYNAVLNIICSKV